VEVGDLKTALPLHYTGRLNACNAGKCNVQVVSSVGAINCDVLLRQTQCVELCTSRLSVRDRLSLVYINIKHSNENQSFQ